MLPGPVEWQPVLARELPGAETFEAFRCREEEDVFRVDVARRARELGLQPLRWPTEFPFDSTLAMRAATYAKSIGRTVPVRAGRVPPGVRRRALARRARQRADRRRGV